MKQIRRVLARVLLVGMVIGLIGNSGANTVQAAEPTDTTAQATGPSAREWSGGAAIGFLGNTPDGTAFALNLNVDRFVGRNVALGPLLQLGFTGDMTLIGFSGQAKSWVDIPETDNRLKLVLQAGLGFVHADFHQADTSWLVPIGVGLDYAVNQTVSLTTTFLLNFTDLDTGPGTHTNVMPGLTFGVRF